MEKSLLDYAYDLLQTSHEPVLFKIIWEYVCENAELSNEQKTSLVSRFLTNMLLDGRFVNVGDGKWELRERLLFAQSHIDMNAVYSIEEEESHDENDDEDDGDNRNNPELDEEDKNETDDYSDEGIAD